MGKTKNRKKVIICWLVGILAVLGCVFAFLWIHAGQSKAAPNTGGMVVAEGTTEWDKTLSGSNSSAGIKIPGYSNLTIYRSADSVNISLVNPKGNPCYFQYTLEVAETGKTLYKSDLIKPGEAITSFQGKNIPAKGNYTLLLRISTYSMDGKYTAMNGAQIKAALTIV